MSSNPFSIYCCLSPSLAAWQLFIVDLSKNGKRRIEKTSERKKKIVCKQNVCVFLCLRPIECTHHSTLLITGHHSKDNDKSNDASSSARHHTCMRNVFGRVKCWNMQINALWQYLDVVVLSTSTSVFRLRSKTNERTRREMTRNRIRSVVLVGASFSKLTETHEFGVRSSAIVTQSLYMHRDDINWTLSMSFMQMRVEQTNNTVAFHPAHTRPFVYLFCSRHWQTECR